MTDMTGERGGGLAGYYGSGDFSVAGDEMYAFLSDNTVPSDKSVVRMTGNMAGFADYGTLSMSDSRVAAATPTIASFTGGAGMSGGAAASAATGSGGAKSAKSKAMDDALEAFRAARDRDIPGPIARR
jgi:hypothetical protein